LPERALGQAVEVALLTTCSAPHPFYGKASCHPAPRKWRCAPGRTPLLLQSARNLTTKAFWPLIDKWQIADEKALTLLSHGGGLTSTGKRLRLTLTVDEAERVSYLKQIDLVLATLFGGTEWLSKPVREQPFTGLSPLDFMIRNQLSGIKNVLRHLNRFGATQSSSVGVLGSGLHVGEVKRS
jgi:hypothetical protein